MKILSQKKDMLVNLDNVLVLAVADEERGERNSFCSRN